MSVAEIEKTVKEVIAEHFRIDEESIRPNALIIDDVDADSLDLVEIVMELEDEFGKDIPDDVVDEWDYLSFQELVKRVAKYVEE